MKSKVWARVIAVMLCMVLMLSTGITVLAETGPEAQEQTTEKERKTEETKNRPENGTAESSDEQTTVTTQQQSEEQMTKSGPEETEKSKEEQTDLSQTVPEEEDTTETEIKEETQESEQKNPELQKEETKVPESETGAEQAEKGIRLEEQTGEYNVVLTGPTSSFPEGTELSLSVSQIDKKVEDMVETAVEEKAKEQDYAVEKYTAFDIRLFSNGEEIQPSGPVHVTFHKRSRDKAEDALETRVYHVDEKTGTAEDMEAQEVKEGQVGIETTHFSIYVLVDLEQLDGKIDLTVQHWANVEQLDGVDGQDGLKPNAPPDNVAGNATASLQVKNVFTKIYADDTMSLDNQLYRNVEELSKVLLADANSTIKNYILKEIWVLKESETAGSDSLDDQTAIEEEKSRWDIYNLTDQDHTIHLNKNSTIRMVYEPVTADNAFSQPVTFYDYNITGGGQSAEAGYIYTDLGINYRGDNDQWTGGNQNNQIAMGLFNNGFYNHRDGAKLGDFFINKGNGNGFVVVKNMVKGVNENGPIYNGLYDKNLFNEIPVNGKTVLKDYTLNFKQAGDVYTLQSVKKGDTTTLYNLDELKEIYDKTTEWSGPRQIFSNNFWPLDEENYNGIDPKFGDKTFAGASDNLRNTKDNNASDDGEPHNWFFGMRYDFEFTLGDYEGPLNFYFRGDDDFWLFVDGELKTDLGGIHSAVGSMLDLSYLRSADKNKVHKITIIYTERGGHGSTCYMQFTLPNVKPVEFDTETEKTSVTVEKKWVDHNNPNRPTSIDVELYYRADESDNWTKYDTETLNQANDWKYTWNGLPKEGYSYKIKESGEQEGTNGKYTVTYQSGMYQDGTLDQNDDGSFSGTITNKVTPSTWITVNKVWKNDSAETRPNKVDFYLYYRLSGEDTWTPYPDGRLTLTKDEAEEDNEAVWKGKYDNLPVYQGNTEKVLEYTVMEVNDNTPLKPGDTLPGESKAEYTVSYPVSHFGNEGEWTAYKAKQDEETMSLTVTNYLPKPWQIIKRSSTSDNLTLPGAKFALTNTKKPSETYIGTSGQEGIVTWVDSDGKEVTSFPDGEYRLEETEAPIGYYLSEETWTLTITEGVPTMSKSGSEGIDQGQIGDQTDTVIFYYKNTPMYALPSSGGVGIYPFIGGGTALMLMGVFLMHRSRKRKLKG
ncbi:fibro-slime domain-containing protein [Sellimonas sp.]|uniref:fibro-slime domain-containing protein n=1 Tax=Sellimonas sp. TaxID=2021466 RepID=UPI0025799E62|nr:fibro-slime domain-containing protein [Sellimonas sp.]